MLGCSLSVRGEESRWLLLLLLLLLLRFLLLHPPLPLLLLPLLLPLLLLLLMLVQEFRHGKNPGGSVSHDVHVRCEPPSIHGCALRSRSDSDCNSFGSSVAFRHMDNKLDFLCMRATLVHWAVEVELAVFYDERAGRPLAGLPSKPFMFFTKCLAVSDSPQGLLSWCLARAASRSRKWQRSALRSPS